MPTEYIGIVNGLKTWNVYDDDGKFCGTNQSAPDMPPVVPDSVTAAQIRLWLHSKGISKEQVTAAIDALPDDTREPTRIRWEWDDPIERTSEPLATVAAAFGMDSAAINAAFVEAASL